MKGTPKTQKYNNVKGAVPGCYEENTATGKCSTKRSQPFTTDFKTKKAKRF